MAFAILLIGLFPVIFLADLFTDQDVEPEDPEGVDAAEPETELSDTGDFIAAEDDAPLAPNLHDAGADPEPIQPISEDEPAHDGSEIDPGDVLAPILDDDPPHGGTPVDPGDVLSPIDEPGEDYDGDGSQLQEALAEETDFTAGLQMLGERVGDMDEVELGEGDDSFAADDDGVPDTGSGTVSDWDGTPILTDTAPVDVISAGGGDDDITLGDQAGYGFGGAGDDTLTAGEGMAALLGGDGDDVITGSETGVGLWADGGSGNDVITGGAANDTLFGGSHTEAGAEELDNDTIDGGDGDDRIAGGFGADTLSGGDGDDVIDHLGRVEENIHWERHDFAWHIDNDADELDGGDGNDQLVMDRADTATGGAGADTFWVYFDDESGEGAADIQDFTIGEDFLRISLNPEIDHGDMALEVAPSANGQDGEVRVNGVPVAILRGAAAASAADVFVEVSQNVFVA